MTRQAAGAPLGRRRTYAVRQALYISLDKARVLAISHARENTGFYLEKIGPSYSKVNFTWEVLSQEESDDYFEVKLSFRPVGHYTGKPGVEQFIFDKLGNLEVRQILDEPSELGAPEVRINDLNTIALDAANIDRSTRQISDRSTAQQGYSDRALSRDSAAFISMGELYIRMSKYGQAIEQYDKAIRVDSRNSTAYNGRGAAYGRLGQFERAIQDFDESIRLAPASAEAYINRGGAYAGLGQFQKAIDDMNVALRLKRNDAVAHYHRGLAYGQLEHPQRAIKDSDEAIRQDPQDEWVFASRAYIHTLMGDKAEAQRDGDRAIQLGIEPEALKRSLAGINNQPLAKKRGLLYTLAKLMGDYNAVKKGKVGRRVGRCVAGKATGKTMRKLFK